MKKLELGISDFKEFIDVDCYFVDKTSLIAWLIDHPSKIHLITRPRRFGKTLNLSMIRFFMEAPSPRKGLKWFTRFRLHHSVPANAYLFRDLSISAHPRYAEFMGQYPVIHLSFKGVKKSTYKDSLEFVKDAIADEFIRHGYLLDCKCISRHEKILIKNIIQKEAGENDYEQSLKYLSSWLNRFWGKPAYILMDEYDTPMYAAYVNNYYEEMIDFIRSFMVQTFKDNPHLKQAVVIGIFKIAQESIFSDFNNPTVSTLMDPEIEDAFGFTETEVQAMVEYFGLENEMDGIKEWYNGYLFGGHTVIYNPWSIINFLRRPGTGFKPHWVNTSDNRLIKKVIKLNSRDAKLTTEKLLRNEEVRKPILTNIPYNDVETDMEVVWSFLLHSGYLKADDMHQEELGTSWRLSIPNKEVKIAWATVVRSWLKEDLAVNEHFTDFVSGIREVNPNLIERGLARILYAMASYHDTAIKKASGNFSYDAYNRRENFYHGLVLGLLASLGTSYIVDSNREYGEGRPDIVVVKKDRDPAWSEEAIVFEFKQGNTDKDTPLESLAREAYAQADAQYLTGVREKWHPKRLVVLGIGFCGKELALYGEGGRVKGEG